ncbi:MAG: class I SAM-dependent methyltransferase [Candidatus Hodarchaeota archaeon]
MSISKEETLKRLLKYILAKLQKYVVHDVEDPSYIYPGGTNIFSITKLSYDLEELPGMITDESGRNLFLIAFTQELLGDIVEIGSWQGKSTIFLAKAVASSGNGRLYAIDHFKGNPGKEHFYVVKENDLSDLQEGFLRNIRRFSVEEFVTLMPMKSEEAARILKTKKIQIRLLFIDGSHEYVDVKTDYENFYDMVIPNGKIIFVDYSRHFPGVVQLVQEQIKKNAFKAFFCHRSMLVAVKK